MLRKMLNSSWFYFSLAGILVVAAVLSQVQFHPPARPRGTVEDLKTLHQRDHLNVVWIVIDMLRADRLSAYGYKRDTSPVMAKLAASGIRFAHVEAQSSWTKASMASMWTSMYPERTGITRFFHAMPQQALMPAEIFHNAGYRTAGIWRNGWVANNFGFGQGFDLYIRPRPGVPDHKVTRHTPGMGRLPGTDMDATLSAIEFMTGAKEDPFFLYVHYMDVHQYLYTDLSPNFGVEFSDFYDSAIYWVDYNVGRIMDALRQLHIADKTLVVIVADHGEAFFEHGIEGHARNLYREVLDTPWIIVPPFRLDHPIVVNERVANIDVWPTILDMVGLPPLPGAEGQSDLPLILKAGEGQEKAGPNDSGREFFAQLDRSWGKIGADPEPTTSVIKGTHRLNYAAKRPDHLELYDHTVDPMEKHNVAAEYPKIAQELKGDIDKFLEKPKTQWDKAPEVELDELHQAQLRALGYVLEPRKRPQRPAGAAADADAQKSDTAPASPPQAP